MTFADPYQDSYPPSLWEAEPPASPPEGEPRLPGDVARFTVADVQTWVDAHQDQAPAVLAAEEARGDAARVTLLDWLHGFIEEPTGDTT